METKASAAESKADLKRAGVLTACITVYEGCAKLALAFKVHNRGLDARQLESHGYELPCWCWE